MDDKVSVIIPTMWKSRHIEKMLPAYESSKYVAEIILIDNAPRDCFLDLEKYRKLIYYTENKNLFVNPSWNKGAELANYQLIIANDDIIIENVNKIINFILSSDFDIVGPLLNERENGMRIQKIKGFPANSYGCFMYVREYYPIPDDLKIWYGDRYLFKYSKKRGRLINGGISSSKSSTIDSDAIYFRYEIGKQDKINFYQMKKEGRF